MEGFPIFGHRNWNASPRYTRDEIEQCKPGLLMTLNVVNPIINLQFLDDLSIHSWFYGNIGDGLLLGLSRFTNLAKKQCDAQSDMTSCRKVANWKLCRKGKWQLRWEMYAPDTNELSKRRKLKQQQRDYQQNCGEKTNRPLILHNCKPLTAKGQEK